jgi:hypothetical protein
MANSHLVKVYHPAMAMQKTSKQAVNLSVHQYGGHPSIGILKILDTEASTAEI